MKFEKAMSLVRSEIEHAQTIHPEWPPDPVHQAAIIAEEAGELVQASLNHHYDKGNPNRMITEAVHTAAVALRFLINMEPGDGKD